MSYKAFSPLFLSCLYIFVSFFLNFCLRRRKMTGGEIVIDLDEFVRSKYPLPPSSHPVNQIMGAFVLSSMRNYAANFYRKENPNLDEYQLLLQMRKKYPSEKCLNILILIVPHIAYNPAISAGVVLHLFLKNVKYVSPCVL